MFRHPRHRCFALLLAVAVAAVGTHAGCTRSAPDDGKIHLTYWEKWERFEGEAMQRVVDAFNARQDRIVVHKVTISLIERKVLTATAGGDPPDIAGLYDNTVASFSDRGVLTNLDPYMKRDGITRDHWIDVYADICTHRGHMWAIPTTPTSTGLHWNKALFRASAGELRAAGLDPERAPATLAELDAYAKVLTKYDENGNIVQMGFLPQEPGWFHWAWCDWFGGHLVDENGNITANHPRNVATFEWLQHFAKDYGADRIGRFSSGFGSFATPQNPFFSGKVAMIVQGVWMHNYITQYAPGMQWGVVPWPKVPGGPEHYTAVGCDVIAIPAGLPKERRDAAWEFVKFVLSREGMEMLNLGQCKNTPIKDVSREFLERHPHPYIDLFIEMSKYDDVMRPLDIGIWNQYQTELTAAFDKMRVLSTNPATGKPWTAQEALDVVQDRMSTAWERHKQSLALRPPVTGE